jgi:hypothetical protein
VATQTPYVLYLTTSNNGIAEVTLISLNSVSFVGVEKCASFAVVVFYSNINNDMAGVSKLVLVVRLIAITK